MDTPRLLTDEKQRAYASAFLCSEIEAIDKMLDNNALDDDSASLLRTLLEEYKKDLTLIMLEETENE